MTMSRGVDFLAWWLLAMGLTLVVAQVSASRVEFSRTHKAEALPRLEEVSSSEALLPSVLSPQHVALSSGSLVSSSEPESSCVFMTTLFTDDFLVGVRVLGYSLRKHHATHPMYVLITDNVSEYVRTTLLNDGWKLLPVKAIENPHVNEPSAQKRLRYVFTKLNVWKMVQFERIVLLDADIAVLENIDSLCKCNARVSAVARGIYFNAGIMVLTPSHEVFDQLMKAAPIVPSYNAGEQGFLNYMIPDIDRCPFFEPEIEDPPPFHPHEEASLLDTWERQPGRTIPPLRDLSLRRCMRLPEYYNGDIGLFVIHGMDRDEWVIDPSRRVTKPRIVHYNISFIKPWLWYAYLILTPSWYWYSLFAEVYSSDIFVAWCLFPLQLTPMIAIGAYAMLKFSPLEDSAVLVQFLPLSLFVSFGMCVYLALQYSTYWSFFSPYGGAILFIVACSGLFEMPLNLLFRNTTTRWQLRCGLWIWLVVMAHTWLRFAQLPAKISSTFYISLLIFVAAVCAPLIRTFLARKPATLDGRGLPVLR
mmetsp:Transcript_11908/g.36263  ORF Transcript_11908/g.36263 Transcript_11908/m.36263 type:complete len:531 (-) Transcript_11908:18-1610(-)